MYLQEEETWYLFLFWIVNVIVFCLEITKLKCIRMIKLLVWSFMWQFILT